jgi:hypothetical protein
VEDFWSRAEALSGGGMIVGNVWGGAEALWGDEGKVD